MKFLLLCMMVVSHSLAAPSKRDVEYYGYYPLPVKNYVPVETTTHYCPEEDFQAEFNPAPPAIKSFPLPELEIGNYPAPVLKQDPPAQPHQEYGVPHEEYGVPHEEYGVPHEEYGVPHEEYGVPHEEYGVPSTEAPTTIPPVLYRYPSKTIVEEPHYKLTHVKSHVVKVHKPVIKYIQPKIVIHKKKIEFPILKKLFKFGHHH